MKNGMQEREEMEAEGHLGRLFVRLFDKHLWSTNNALGVLWTLEMEVHRQARASCRHRNDTGVGRDKPHDESPVIAIVISGIC